MSTNIDNTGRHIEKITFDTICKKHDADRGEPCYTSVTGDETIMFGVCGPRIKKAGFNGKISDDSLRKKTFVGRRS